MYVLLCLAPLAGFLLAVWYIQFRWRYRHIISAAAKLPCPPTWPLIGNILNLGRDFTSLSDNIRKFTGQYNGTFCVWEGLIPVFIVTEPADLQVKFAATVLTILNSSNALEKDYSYNLLKPIGVDGLVSSPVSIWKKYRRLINPVLHPSNVKWFIPIFNDVSRDLVDSWSEVGENFEPKDQIFNMLLRALFGTVMPVNHVEPEVLKSFQKLFHIGGILHIMRVFKVWLRFDWLFKILHSKDIQDFSEVRTLCMEFLDKVLKNWKSRHSRVPDLLHTNKSGSAKNLLDVISDNPPDESDPHDWKDEMKTMVAAATSTSVEALQLLLVTLANYPDVQAKVLAEIQEVLGDSERDITSEDLNSMPYLGQTILESLRLHGGIAVILRQASGDINLTTCTLPNGSRILIPLHAMGWNSQLFPEPAKFLPERFSPENLKKRHNSSFLPFSGGPRNCIGKTFALSFLKIVLVHIIRRYSVKSEVHLEDIKYEVTTVRHSKTPLLFTFTPHC